MRHPRSRGGQDLVKPGQAQTKGGLGGGMHGCAPPGPGYRTSQRVLGQQGMNLPSRSLAAILTACRCGTIRRAMVPRFWLEQVPLLHGRAMDYGLESRQMQTGMPTLTEEIAT